MFVGFFLSAEVFINIVISGGAIAWNSWKLMVVVNFFPLYKQWRFLFDRIVWMRLIDRKFGSIIVQQAVSHATTRWNRNECGWKWKYCFYFFLSLVFRVLTLQCISSHHSYDESLKRLHDFYFIDNFVTHSHILCLTFLTRSHTYPLQRFGKLDNASGRRRRRMTFAPPQYQAKPKKYSLHCNLIIIAKWVYNALIDHKYIFTILTAPQPFKLISWFLSAEGTEKGKKEEEVNCLFLSISCDTLEKAIILFLMEYINEKSLTYIRRF